MNKFKRCFILVLMIILIISNNIVLFAHSEVLDVSYDECIPERYVSSTNIGDGENEKWYDFILDNNAKHYHISYVENGTTTIKYIFKNTSESIKPTETGIDLWLSEGFTNAEITQYKTTLANSMKKWNNVYFYKYDEDGNVAKKKIVNVIEGTSTDYNLIIYPTVDIDDYASTKIDTDATLSIIGANNHIHYDKYKMNFNIKFLKTKTQDEVAMILARTMAHELGHVLGLADIDYYENLNNPEEHHHEEVLMGYSKEGNSKTTRQQEITYKDIAGVAITRGYHTDLDHKWLYDSVNSTIDNYKLICSICNGVKYVDNLTAYSYDNYKYCNNNHLLSYGNMMAVASYGTKDYYKCKYCRYVAPFTSVISQNYKYVNYGDGTYHKRVNQVTGLEYSVLEEHSLVLGSCKRCGYMQTHTCNFLSSYYNNREHLIRCLCGNQYREVHYVSYSDVHDGDGYALCLGCDTMLDFENDIANIIRNTNEIKYSINGSYILSNGIVILVDDDIDNYINGSLIFYNKNEIPTIE